LNVENIQKCCYLLSIEKCEYLPDNNRFIICNNYWFNVTSYLGAPMKYISTFSLLLFLIVSFLMPAQQITFSDVAGSMGINHAPLHRYGGISFCDFDEDGFEDISMNSDAGYPAYVFKNNSNNFEYFSPQLGLNDSLQSELFLWVDYDNDGDRDLFIGYWDTFNRLYRNDGNFVLTEITAQAGLPLDSMTTMAACWGDYDNDGFLDLYFTNYSEFQRNYLFHNNGDGTFTDVTIAAGVQDALGGTNFYKTPLAVVFFDFNLDGWQDIYIANDHFASNTLYKNMGDGTFTDVSISSNANVSGFMMGIAVGDYDNDGDFDLYVSNDPYGNYLLKNNGDETFTEIADSLGLSVNKVCWGVNFFDYDNDTDLDLYVSVAEGTVNYENVMFANNGDGSFMQMFGIGLDDQKSSYGNAIGDYNNDGFYDIAVYNQIDLMNLYKNSGNTNNWIKLSLEGVISNREGTGSLIEFFIDGNKMIRQTHCGISYMSQNSSSLIIGAGEETEIDSIIIKWAGSGNIDILRNVAVNQTITVVEGSTVTEAEVKELFPAGFSLEQNYPNPFNPSTTIKFNLAENSYVTLSIFNVLGEEIAILIDNELTEGRYEVKFDALYFISSVYFYRLTAYGNSGIKFTSVKKMILSK